MFSIFRPFALFSATHQGLALRPRAWAVGLGLAAGLCAPAQALMIGAPQTRAELGRALQMTIPIRLDPQESLPLSCVQAQAQAGDYGHGLGTLSIGSSPSAEGVTLSLRSQQPLREPILIVRLHLACQYQRTQVYTLLVDPPAPELPMVAGSAAAPSLAASPSSRAPQSVSFDQAPSRPSESLAAAPQARPQPSTRVSPPVRRDLASHERRAQTAAKTQRRRPAPAKTCRSSGRWPAPGARPGAGKQQSDSARPPSPSARRWRGETAAESAPRRRACPRAAIPAHRQAAIAFRPRPGPWQCHG